MTKERLEESKYILPYVTYVIPQLTRLKMPKRDVHGSVHHNTNLIEMTNKIQLCRQFIILLFLDCSTCFER
jgi:hypothetical protein